jgi:MFS transporter, SP family, arabinose:H+ symporter
MVFLVAAIAAIAGFLFGFDEGIIAGSLHLVREYFHLSEAQTGIMTSALPFGALAGSILIGLLLVSSITKHLGRKKAIILAGILFFFGAMGSALCPSVSLLILARFLLGVAIGIAAVTAPLYIAEVAPSKYRGAMVAMYQFAITLGIVCAYFINYLMVDDKAWRGMFASASIPAIILTLGVFFLPESPRWLVSVGRDKDANDCLEKLGRIDVASEIESIKKTVALEEHGNNWRLLFKTPLLSTMMLGFFLLAFQQLSGINVIIYYAPEIFKNLGFTTMTTQILATLGIGIVNMLVTVLALFWVDKIGRRKLALFGFSGTFISLIGLSVCYFIGAKHLNSLSILFITMYIFSFAIALGPIPFIIMSEIFPLNVRGAGMSLSLMSNWCMNGLVVFSFPIMLANLGIGYTLTIYATMCFIGFWISYHFMPETKGLSLEEIESYTFSGKPLRLLGRCEQKDYEYIPIVGGTANY